MTHSLHPLTMVCRNCGKTEEILLDEGEPYEITALTLEESQEYDEQIRSGGA